jgi:hypothetical protein
MNAPRPFPIPRCVTPEGVCFAGMQRMSPGAPLALLSPGAADVLQAACHEQGHPGPVGGPGAHVAPHFFTAAGGAVFLGHWRGLALYVYRGEEAVSWWTGAVLTVPSSNPGGALKGYGLGPALFSGPLASPDSSLPGCPPALPRGLVPIGAWSGVRLVVADVGPQVLVTPPALDVSRWG